MRRLSLVFAIVLMTSIAATADWSKAYFGATPPGSWAKYENKATAGGNSTSTLVRLPDADGRVRIEERTESSDGAAPPSNTRYEMGPKFNVDRDLIDYPKALVAFSTSTGTDPVEAMPAATVAALTSAMNQYGPSAVFKGVETVGGKSSDHYRYAIGAPGSPTRETGDLWLTAAVPFGVVKRTWTTTDGSGKVLFSGEQLLIDSGMRGAPALTRGAPPAPKPRPTEFTLKAAYDAGMVSVEVVVAPGSKLGDRLTLTIQSTGEEPFTLTVPTGQTTLYVDVPFENLIFRPSRAQRFQLTASRPAVLEVTQLGDDMRVTEGTFKITVMDGKPWFVGGATMTPLKK